MAHSRILSGTTLGVHALAVEVEVDAREGLRQVNVIGTTEHHGRETLTRVQMAIKHSGIELHKRHVTVNLSPGDIRKDGTQFDLPVAVAMLEAHGIIPPGLADGALFVGELSLEGALRPVRGVLSFAVMARENGIETVIVPRGNAREAAVVAGIKVIGCTSLREVVNHLTGRDVIQPTVIHRADEFTSNDTNADFAEVHGQEHAKRALEIAAAGGHHVLMMGPPGSGKTMLARRLAGILPPLTFGEAMETTKVYSVAGLMAENEALVTRRPFRAPHHTISDAGLVGGGNIPRPGEASLAHNGVLFLDALPEFKRHVLEVLRQPLEDKRVTIARLSSTLVYPANMMLVGAMQPCPCGFAGDASRECTCDAGVVTRYRARVDGFLRDQMNIQVTLPAIRYRVQKPSGDSSATIRERVTKARDLQSKRFVQAPRVHCNAQMGPRLIRRYCALAPADQKLLEGAVDPAGMSARLQDRILKVARTIADLAGSETIQTAHLSEALNLSGV